MNMLKAMRETLAVAKDRDYDNVTHEEVGVSFDHIMSMLARVEGGDEQFSEAKLGRWLGYMQGVLVANATCTLEEVKEINRKYADDWTHMHKKRGTKYKVIGIARAQCSVIPICDGDALTLYQGEDGTYSVRPPAEFSDGRFERVPLVLSK